MASHRTLRAKYRRWTREGRSVQQWRELLDAMARDLHVVRVAVSRLVLEREDWFDGATLRRRIDEARTGQTDGWPPIVVEGMPHAGKLLVVDGNHRVYAAKHYGRRGLWIAAVFARLTPYRPDLMNR